MKCPYLQNRFNIDELEGLYDRYYLRIQNSYFNVYLLLQVVLSFVYILILLAFSFAHDDKMERYPEIRCSEANKTEHFGCHEVSYNLLLQIFITAEIENDGIVSGFPSFISVAVCRASSASRNDSSCYHPRILCYYVHASV